MSKFPALEDDDKVAYLAFVLDGCAKRFYYQEILSRSTTLTGTGAWELP